MAHEMIRIRALDRFKRYYYHALRAGKKSENAADEAMTRMKKDVQRWLDADSSLDEYAKRELWGDVFRNIIEWQMLLTDVMPTAPPALLTTKIEALDKKEEAEKIKDAMTHETRAVE